MNFVQIEFIYIYIYVEHREIEMKVSLKREQHLTSGHWKNEVENISKQCSTSSIPRKALNEHRYGRNQ